MTPVLLCDTTLRDDTQREDLSLSLKDKLTIAKETLKKSASGIALRA